jgi:hypothetical protein
MPGSEIRKCPQAVNAGVIPEFNEDDAPEQIVQI